MSTPYVVSSDLVSAYPAKSLEIAQFIDGYKTTLNMVQNAQTGTTYTLALTDFTKLVTLSNASPVAVTLPLESSVAWPTGTQLRLLNQGAGTVTVAGAVGVTINGSPLTLTQYKGANLIKTGTNVWTFIPFASGVGAANFTDAATGTYSGYKYKTYTASGTITIDVAGFGDILVIGGGGGGGEGNSNYGGGGGGAGGYLAITDAYLVAGTLTVTIGAGGATSTQLGVFATPGNPSRLGDYYGVGGAPGMTALGGATFMALVGGSGFGGAAGEVATRPGGTGLAGQGNNGGDGFGTSAGATTAGGGGGGAGAVGQNASSSTGGNGGAGVSSSITGSAVGRGGGGGGTGVTGGSATDGGGAGGAGAGGNGTANTGGGAGGGRNGDGGTGGSGVVIIRVAV